MLPIAINYDGSSAVNDHGFQLHTGPMRSKSRGWVKITSSNPKSNPKIKYIKSLLLRKNRNQTGLFLAEGERTCREAIEHKWNPKYLVYSNEKNQTINFICLFRKIKLQIN